MCVWGGGVELHENLPELFTDKKEVDESNLKAFADDNLNVVLKFYDGINL